MCRRSQFFCVALFVVLALIGSPPSAQAIVLPPGSSAVVPENFAPGFVGALQAAIATPFVGLDGSLAVHFQGILVQNVVTDTFTGNLDFLYQIQRTPGPGIDDIRRMTTGSYNNFILDVGYCTLCADLVGIPALNGYKAPNSLDRSGGGGNVVGFDFNTMATAISDSSQSYVLVIKTNAKTFALGSTSVIDDATANIITFAPTPEPAFVGLLLSGLFGVGLFFARRFRVTQS